jgi:hypothetical protein
MVQNTKVAGGKPLVDNPELSKEERGISEGHSDPADAVKSAKKKFIVPEISVPVDVLEATTFFQLTDSGNTQP